MQPWKIYLDTSVISFLFATDSPEFTSITREFFERHAKFYRLHISNVVLLEISKNANRGLMQRMYSIATEKGIVCLEGKEEINELAKAYID